MKLIIILLACLKITSCYSQQNDKNQNKTLSKDNLKIIFERCKNPDIIEVETSKDGFVEVEFLCNGNRYEIGIKNNQFLYSEHSRTISESVFEKINKKIEKKYAGWFIDEISEIQTNDTAFIKVELLKEGIEQNLYFTNDGKWFKIKPIDVTSTIDFKLLEKNKVYKSAKYTFNKPDSVYEMPDYLREISGIVVSKYNTIYCIQDEIGSIFEFNITKQEISNSFRFTDLGDFEDLAINQNILYILRSDGNLFSYDLIKKQKTNETMLQLNSLNIEGICFNNGYIYIACKDALVTQTQTKRIIYRIKANKLNTIEPFLVIDIDSLNNFISLHYKELQISNILFNPSAIAIHPISNDVYVLSASDRFIAIYRDLQLLNIIPLSAEVYYKPEGLSFDANGDLYISSEGDKKGFVKGSINVIKL